MKKHYLHESDSQQHIIYDDDEEDSSYVDDSELTLKSPPQVFLGAHLSTSSVGDTKPLNGKNNGRRSYNMPIQSNVVQKTVPQ